MVNFQFRTAPRVVCEPGAAAKLGVYLSELGITKPLLITDPGLMSINLVPPLIEAMKQAGLDCVLFDGVAEDPPESVVHVAVELGRQCDGVIAVGGGSSMDVAKVAAALLGGTQALAQMYGVDQVKGARLPLVLIPTTAGTGSEVTPVAVITTGETTKAGISSPVLLPDIAVLDAELTLGLPAHVTAMTGIDAMVHAIEAYTSKIKKNPVSDRLARQALTLLSANQRRVLSHPDDVAAREAMLLGATLAGQAFANAPVAAVHALAYPLGGHYHMPHGLSNALMLPAVLRFNAPAAEALYMELAPLLPDPVAPGVEGFVSWFEDLIADAA